MTTLTAGTAARAYLVVVLVLSVLFASPLQLGVALFLVALQVYFFYKVPAASLNLALVVASLILAPLALEALVGVYAFLLVLPGLFLLDESLRAVSLTQVLSFSHVGRRASDVLKILSICLLLVLSVSIVVWNITLMLTATVLLGFIGSLVLSALRRMPKGSLVEGKSWSRIVAGDTETATLTITSRAKVPVTVHLAPVDSWVHLGQQNLTFSSNAITETPMRFTPPLAGPSKIRINAAYIDLHGLVVTGQVLEPLDLHIIPRAKYAQWLASKYLERTSSGAGIMVDAPRSNSFVAKHGVEFQGNRPYQAGDRLKDIDWRHAYMLGELIVKEFSGAQGNTVVIVADLTAMDLEDADRLAYNLVMTALTLATESLPSALALYNQQDVVAVTQPMNSRETLKKTLELTEKISIVESKQTVLEPAQIGLVNRSINQLTRLRTLDTEQLSRILQVEVDAHLEAAKSHPATLALAKAVKYLQGPAVITVISSRANDSEALAITIDQLKARGYSAIAVHDPGKR